MTLAACNLRVNPFGAPFAHERGRLAVPVVDLDALVARLRDRRCAVQLMGRPGSGKTTHLCALHERFSSMPLYTVPERGPAPPIDGVPVVFIDEAQRLHRLPHGSSFVLATHRSHERALRRAGIEVLTVHLAGLMLPLLSRYVALRMEWARLGPGPLPAVPTALLERLWRQHRSDVRAIEDALYDWLQPEPVVAH